MEPLHSFSGLNPDCYAQSFSQPSGRQTSLFRSIPPERIGLHGEYDHDGLSKRVQIAFQQVFSPHTIRNLRISQRGAVVVVTGSLDKQLLHQLVSVAMDVEGTVGVEVNGDLIFPSVALSV